PGLQEYYYEENQDNSIEVPLETRKISIEPFDLESIHLTENIEDSKSFDNRDSSLYPVVPEMSFDN
ncbi:300_t:CDS:1, partial [Diversispora eburnea]